MGQRTIKISSLKSNSHLFEIYHKLVRKIAFKLYCNVFYFCMYSYTVDSRLFEVPGEDRK